jgi:organic radical activating enzyme
MNIRRTTLVITQKCTLKCKLCLAFMPYYKNPTHMPYDVVCNVIDNYFKIVDNVKIFSITGGEPLLHPNLVDILRKIIEYSDKIEDKIDIVTNGTIMFSNELIEFLEKNKNKMRVILSDYGCKLSKKIENISRELTKANIPYRIQNYSSDSDIWTYNGWVDFTDHSLKHRTENELIEQGKKCIFRLGHYYVINDGELHPCSRQYWRMHENIIPKDDYWYIDLKQRKMNIQKEEKKLQCLEEKIYLNSCAYCNGVYNGIKRYKPAEQL